MTHACNVGPKRCPEELVSRLPSGSEAVCGAHHSQQLLLHLEEGKEVRGEETVSQVGHLHHHLEGAIFVSLDQKFTHLRGRSRGGEGVMAASMRGQCMCRGGWEVGAGLPTSLLALK